MRPVDADAVIQKLKDNGWLKMNVLENSAEMIAVHAILLDAPTLEPPPNRPLTLEELRKMKGEPVWVEELSEEFQGRNRCRVLECLCGPYVLWTDDSFNVADNYDTTWRAYRRKQEEGDSV